MNRFKTAIATTTLLVGLIGVAPTPAMAQDRERYHDRYDRDQDRRDRDYNRDRDHGRDYDRDHERDYDRDHNRDWRRDRREWRRYDDDRFERGPRRYDAVRGYYWDAPYAPTWRLERDDNIYRSYDDQYYCQRSDGTKGLIVGGITGGVLGNIIAPGHSKALGTILGAAGGAIVGRGIDRNNIVCR